MTQNAYLLPGLMCDHRLWQEVLPQLTNINPVPITFKPHQNIESMLDDVTEQLELDPANLVGFSMGGYVALRYALKFPQAVSKLVLIGSSGKSLSDQERAKRNKIVGYLQGNHYNGINDLRLKQFIHPRHLKGPIAATIKAMDKSLGKDYLLAQLAATAQRPSLLDKLHQLNCPVLIIGAQDDQLIPPQQMIELAGSFNNATIEIIPDCGHMSPMEAPVQVGKLISDFLAL